MNTNNGDDHHSNNHRSSNVSSSEDASSAKEQQQVSTTSSSNTNNSIEDNNTNSSSSSSSSDQDDSSSNGPTTSSSTPPSSSSSSNILRPPVLLRPSTLNTNSTTSSSTGASSTTSRPLTTPPPTITITPSESPKPASSASAFLRPSKLQVKETPSSASAVVSPTDDKPNVFVPLTRDANSVNGDGKNNEMEKSVASSSEPASSSTGTPTAQQQGAFLFGEKLEDRVSSSQDRKRKLSGDNNEPGTSSGGGGSSSKVPALEDVDVSTGEEGEVNVMQVPCRLYTFDPSTTNWTERVSRGVLRLNDTDSSNSRLIVRTQGSLRLMLNTKIFNGMVVERPNDKSVKFTAVDIQDEVNTGGVKVFLVMGSYSDMDSLYNALLNRLRRFNQ